MKKLVVKIKTGKWFTSYLHGENRLNQGKIKCRIVRKKGETKNSFSQTQLCSSFSSPLSYLHQPSVAQGDGEWGLLSVHSSSSPLLPHTFTLLQFGAPSMGFSLSWGYLVRALLWLFKIYSTWLFSTRYRLLQCRSPMKCSSRKPTSAQDLPRLQLLHGLSICCSLGTSLGAGGHVLQVDMCSNVILHEMQGASLCHHGHLQGILCSSTWRTSSPSSSPCWQAARLFLPVFSKSSPTVVALWFFWNASLNKLS